ncbi:hypothetical protein K523DRAFT_377051 [Schizophyllum commune Tattone D]|nr:hypothetical protein K523DRAFT_377051 [Schizophyllum commune Tattone D]
MPSSPVSSSSLGSRSLTPSVRSDTPPPAESLPSTATSSPSPADIDTDNQTATPIDASATSTVVTSQTTASPNDAVEALTEAPLTKMWSDAVAECQRKMGVDFLAPDASHFDSKEAVVSYVTKREEEQKDELERSQWCRLRGRLVPLARIIENLCAPVGDALSTTFPPGKAIFTAVGLIVSASIKTHEEMDQIGDAFDEIKRHLQVVDVVVGSQCGDLLYDASTKLLVQLIIVLATILKTWRDGHLRVWLRNLVHSRPLSEALQDLHRLATQHHEAIAGVTYKKVTEMMSSIADGTASQASSNQLLHDVLQVAHGVQAEISLTKDEIVANRAILRHLDSLFFRQAEEMKEIKSLAELDKVAQWLSYPDSSPKLSRLLDDRAEGTGSWFLDGDVFTAFREGNSSTKFVLLSGKVGSGRSTLIAAATQALQAYCAAFAPDSLVLVHLFDTTNGSIARDMHSLFAALLYQIALKSPRLARTIIEYRKKAIKNGFTTKTDKEYLLMNMLRAASPRIFIVIDALDESDEADILHFLGRLKKISAVSLLASRRTSSNTSSTFEKVISITTNETDNDIGTALDAAMSPGGVLQDIGDRGSVRQALLAGAEGNFRWASLVTQELKTIAGMPGKVRQRLKALPASLEALYKACLDAIAPADRADVRCLLLWLIRSTRGRSTMCPSGQRPRLWSIWSD